MVIFIFCFNGYLTFGTSGGDYIRAVYEEGNSFYFVSTTNGYTNANAHAILGVMSQYGTISILRRYYVNASNPSYNLWIQDIKTNISNIYMVGSICKYEQYYYVCSNSSNPYSSFLGLGVIIKTDKAGNISWYKVYDYSSILNCYVNNQRFSHIYSSYLTSDGNLLIGGEATFCNTSGLILGSAAFISKISSSNGNILWNIFIYDSSGGVWGNSAIVSLFEKSGYYYAIIQSTRSIGIIKIQTDASFWYWNRFQLPFNIPQQQRTTGRAIPTSDGNYVFVGVSHPGAYSTDILVVKIASDPPYSYIIFSKVFPYNGNDVSRDIIERNYDYIIAGNLNFSYTGSSATLISVNKATGNINYAYTPAQNNYVDKLFLHSDGTSIYIFGNTFPLLSGQNLVILDDGYLNNCYSFTNYNLSANDYNLTRTGYYYFSTYFPSSYSLVISTSNANFQYGQRCGYLTPLNYKECFKDIEDYEIFSIDGRKLNNFNKKKGVFVLKTKNKTFKVFIGK